MGKNHYTAPTIHVEEPETDNQVSANVEPDVAPVATGKVVDCGQLNVRRAPSLNATVVCVIERDTEVTIDEGKSNEEWYHVDVNPHTHGFCMKKYIAISQ